MGSMILEVTRVDAGVVGSHGLKIQYFLQADAEKIVCSNICKDPVISYACCLPIRTSFAMPKSQNPY